MLTFKEASLTSPPQFTWSDAILIWEAIHLLRLPLRRTLDIITRISATMTALRKLYLCLYWFFYSNSGNLKGTSHMGVETITSGTCRLVAATTRWGVRASVLLCSGLFTQWLKDFKGFPLWFVAMLSGGWSIHVQIPYLLISLCKNTLVQVQVLHSTLDITLMKQHLPAANKLSPMWYNCRCDTTIFLDSKFCKQIIWIN